MHFYNPSQSPLSLEYLPLRSYRPAYPYFDGEPSSAFAFEERGRPVFSYAPLPRLDAETRYRRAVHELQAAEQEFEAHISLKRARQAAILRQRAAAEASRRERALAIRAEVERIESACALQAQSKKNTSDAALHRGYRQQNDSLRALVDASVRKVAGSEPRVTERQSTHSRPTCSAACHDSESLTFGGLLKLFTEILPQLHPTNPPESSASPTPSQQHPPAEPQPSSSKQDEAEASLNSILEFFHGIAAQASGVTNDSQHLHEPSFQPTSPTLLEALFKERSQGTHDQEMRDIERAIELSLQYRNAADAKKAHATKAFRSSPGASSSNAKVEKTVSSGAAASLAHSTAPGTSSGSIPSPAPQPASPLTTIRTVRTQLSTLESAFKFPAVLDFDRSELAVTSNNAPVRAYEYALNGLLEQLDAIDSDGDEEVRNVRREVVREVEKALEGVERKVRDRVPPAPVAEVTQDEVKGYNVDADEPEVTATRDVPSADLAPLGEDVQLTEPKSAIAISPVDADIDLAISEEYFSTAPVDAPSKLAVAEVDSATAAPIANEDALNPDDADDAPVSENASDSVATVTAASAISASNPSSNASAPASPAPETFLTSMSHDHFTFPPKPASISNSATSSAETHDDAVLVDDSVGGESERGAEDGWSEVDA
ncbi:hypothetical protein B0F90DRAFT_1730216 [Multifurca ochricompacta]|uniref:BAG domain-containing protein n=1 Tax=Multifurca ochricompacta TaxID=376703 RepID=A0AAD4M2L3_9AGAM|nr:hypothetical protein B0F90DRAFT_1730216 [Multifurca ochricompacta]